MSIASKYNLVVIEDAAQGVNSFYKIVHLDQLVILVAFLFTKLKMLYLAKAEPC